MYRHRIFNSFFILKHFVRFEEVIWITIFKISKKSEAFASEFLENLEEMSSRYYIHSAKVSNLESHNSMRIVTNVLTGIYF